MLGSGTGLLAAFISVIAPVQAGAWTRSLGDHYTKVSADFYRTSDYVVPGFGNATNRGYTGQQYSVYTEVGLWRRPALQLALLLPVSIGAVEFTEARTFQSVDVRATTTRVGDLRIVPQVALFGDGAPFSAALDIKLPLYENSGIGDDFGSYGEVFALAGDGQIDFTGWLLAGTARQVPNVWVDAALGYRHRTEMFIGYAPDVVFVDGVTAHVGSGAVFGPWTGVFLIDAVVNTARDHATRQGLSMGPGLHFDLGRGWMAESRLQGEVWVRNASQGVSYGFGLSRGGGS